MLECHENLVDKVRDLIPVDFFAGNHLMERALVFGEDEMKPDYVFVFGVVVIEERDDVRVFDIVEYFELFVVLVGQ